MLIEMDRNDIAHVDLIKEALLRFHLCVLRLSKHSPEDERVEASKIFVDSALDHHIQQMVNNDPTPIACQDHH